MSLSFSLLLRFSLRSFIVGKCLSCSFFFSSQKPVWSYRDWSVILPAIWCLFNETSLLILAPFGFKSELISLSIIFIVFVCFLLLLLLLLHLLLLVTGLHLLQLRPHRLLRHFRNRRESESTRARRRYIPLGIGGGGCR